MKKISLLAVGIFALAFSVQGQDAKYTNNSFARLSYVDGKTFIQRAADLGYEDGVANMPISEGDRIGTAQGRAEIYLGRKNYIRMDQNAKIDFLSLPKADSIQVRVREWAGNVYLDIRSLDKEKGIEVLTSDATFYILDEGRYRIDVRENDRTEILVFSGLVEASGEEGSTLVKAEQRLVVSAGRFESKPSAFFASADDAFDNWNEERDSKVDRTFARKYLPAELEDFEGELDDNGEWIDTPEFGYVWTPRGLAPDWRPYSYGRWMWLPAAGWCWVPYEPWGWSTFHYGRWQWSGGLGWYWIPMGVWSPAWVNWWWDTDYFAWAPLSYWGYPGVIIDNFYFGRGYRDYGDYPFYSRALTIVHKNQLQSPDIRRAALGAEAIKSVGRISLTNRSLDIRPARGSQLSPERIEGGRGVILRKGSEGSGLEPADRTPKTTVQGREIRKPSTDGKKDAEDRGKSDAAGTAGRTIEKKKGDSPPPSDAPRTPERRIRKKKDSESEPGPGALALTSPARRTEGGGRTVSDVAKDNAARSMPESGSLLEKLFRSFSADNGGSLEGEFGRGSISKGSPSGSSPRGAIAPRSGGAASGRSSAPPSGRVRKK